MNCRPTVGSWTRRPNGWPRVPASAGSTSAAGCGELSLALWKQSGGRLAKVVGLDFAAVNAAIYTERCAAAEPPPSPGRFHFIQADFLTGLAACADASFDGVVSGMAIQYAESFCSERQTWTTDAYDRVLAEVQRVLRPGGTFVFSVNVPEPSWFRLACSSLKGILRVRQPLRYPVRAVQMMSYGAWLKASAARPLSLSAAGNGPRQTRRRRIR